MGAPSWGGGTTNRKGQPATSQPVEKVCTVVAPSPPARWRPRRSMRPFSFMEGAWPARRLVTPIRGVGVSWRNRSGRAACPPGYGRRLGGSGHGTETALLPRGRHRLMATFSPAPLCTSMTTERIGCASSRQTVAASHPSISSKACSMDHRVPLQRALALLAVWRTCYLELLLCSPPKRRLCRALPTSKQALDARDAC